MKIQRQREMAATTSITDMLSIPMKKTTAATISNKINEKSTPRITGKNLEDNNQQIRTQSSIPTK